MVASAAAGGSELAQLPKWARFKLGPKRWLDSDSDESTTKLPGMDRRYRPVELGRCNQIRIVAQQGAQFAREKDRECYIPIHFSPRDVAIPASA